MTSALPTAILLTGIGATLLANFMVNRRQGRIAARLAQLQDGQEVPLPEGLIEKPRVTFLANARKWLTTQAAVERVQRDLDGAGLSLRADEFLFIVLGSALSLPVIGFVVSGDRLITITMALVGYFAPWRLVRYARKRRKLRLEVQLADALTLIAAALRAGHTAIQSMEVATQQLPPPICEEFGRVIFNVNLGMPIAEALTQMSERVHSYEYDMMVSAVTIQLEVGGSITNLLDSIADTIRDRASLRDEIRALTAQGRLSGILLSLMPVALFILMLFMNRPYADLLLKDDLGRKILNSIVVMEIIGWTFINRILNVRV